MGCEHLVINELCARLQAKQNGVTEPTKSQPRIYMQQKQAQDGANPEAAEQTQVQHKDQHKPEYSLFREKGHVDSLFSKAV